MAGWKCPSSSLAMDPYLAELGMILLLHQIVADLINQLQLVAKYLLKRFSHLFKDDQSIDDCKVTARSHGVQVIAIVLRLRREISEVYVGDGVRLLCARQLEVVSSQSMSPAARAGVRLDED